MIIGLGKDENFIASDIPAILSRTRNIYRLNDNEIAVLKRDGVAIFNVDKELIPKSLFTLIGIYLLRKKADTNILWQKKLWSSPKAVRDTISPRIKNGKIVLDNITLTSEQIKNFSKIFIVACGSAYHVGMVAKYVLEKFTRIPVEVDVASEFRYRDPIIDNTVLVLIISQSGETADTLAALREAKRLGARSLSIVNVVGSSIANDSDDVIYTWAGPKLLLRQQKPIVHSCLLFICWQSILPISWVFCSLTNIRFMFLNCKVCRKR